MQKDGKVTFYSILLPDAIPHLSLLQEMCHMNGVLVKLCIIIIISTSYLLRNSRSLEVDVMEEAHNSMCTRKIMIFKFQLSQQ